MDYTGTGNSMNMRHPHVLQLIMDSLRYWVSEMHVDGFRFDLAATLARELHEVDRLSSFFDLIQQDPIVSQVKLIAEPWDIGEGGYQVGNFPPLWSEWNGKYRDTVRDFWRGTDRTLAEFAYRLTGSSDLYEGTARSPYASINFITAHDGFTLRDLVSYNDKHNEANGEDNRDGESHNRSWNCGVEGPTSLPDVNALRARQQRNFLATLMLSQGVPMLLGGDELGRTQNGNNNGYCQDNELSWYDWARADERLLQFARRLIRLRHRHPVFCRRRWFQGREPHGPSVGRYRLVRARGHRDVRGRLAGGFRQVARRVPERRRHPDPERARRARRRRQLLHHVQRAPRGARVPAATQGLGREMDAGARYLRERGRDVGGAARAAAQGRRRRPGAGLVARPAAADCATCRAIMTSVDLMTASASSPRRSLSSSIASRVMIAVSV